MKHAILVLVALCACDRQLNPEFCLAHPDDVRCGGGPDAPAPCNDNADCVDQVCNTAVRPSVCVQCTATDVSQCPSTAPVCADDNTCRACASDSECASDVCLPDGSCASEDRVVYVATDGDPNAGCGSRATPCTVAQSILEVTDERAVIRLLPNSGQDYLVAGSGGFVITKDVTIVARGASFGRTSVGAIMTVTAGRTVTLLGGVIKGGLGTSGGHGIVCNMMSVLRVVGADIGPHEADGINVTSCGVFLDRVVIHNNDGGIRQTGGSLELQRSTLSNNVEGGIILGGANTRFDIVNNVFWLNGGPTSNTGAIRVATDTSTTSRLELNSFHQNNAFNTGAAVSCDVPGFVARNNVLFGNGDANNLQQVSGVCGHSHSIVAPGNLPPGIGNITDDPLFIAPATGNLRTMPGSPTEGAGDPLSDLGGLTAVDFDGEPRTTPPDIGIDEHP